MKKSFFSLVLVLLVALSAGALLLSGCGGGGGSSTYDGGGGGGTGSTDQTQIENIVTQNSSGIFGFEDSDAADGDVEYQNSNQQTGYGVSDIVAGYTPHQRWYRGYTTLNNTITPTIEGDTADVVITRHYTGTFHVKPTIGGNPITKPMDDSLTQRAQFKKINNVWTLHAVTPLVLTPTDGQTLASISQVDVYQGETKVFTITDPAALIPVADLPVLNANDTIKLEVTTKYNGQADTTSVLTFIHHGRRGVEYHHRNIALDNGSQLFPIGDLVAGDAIFTRMYEPGVGSTYWKRGAADVLRASCLWSSENDYQSNVWVFPYKITPQE